MSIDEAIAAVVRAAVRAAVAPLEAKVDAAIRQLADIEAGLPQYVTADEAAKRLSISRATCWRRIKAGEIPVFRLAGRTMVPVSALRRVSDEAVAAMAVLSGGKR